MPSAFTHAFVGSALTAFAPRTAPRLRLATALAVLAAAPDLDVIGFRVGITYGSVLGHRGASHSVAAALAVGAIVWILLRKRADARWIATLCCVATASHGFLDAFTNAGLGVGFLIPFSGERFFFPWRPISTSSLDPAAFFSREGLSILGNELRWVWLPVAAIALAAIGWRKARERSP